MITVALVGTLIAGVCTLAMWSYLYKENMVYRLFENIFIATGAATSLVFALKYIRESALTPLLQGDIVLIIPILLGLTAYLYYSKNYYYLYRIPSSFLVGIGTGLGIRGAIHNTLFKQVNALIKPILVADPMTSVNNIIILFGVVTTMVYFIFTFKSTGLSTTGKIGRYVIMTGFGAKFGQVVMGRMTYFIGRAQFMLTTEAIYLIPIAIVVVAIDVWRHRTEK